MNMNVKKTVGIIAMFLLPFLFSGCWDSTEIDVKTEVKADGSCRRTIRVTRDSGEMDELGRLSFPVPLDKTWNGEQKVNVLKKEKEEKEKSDDQWSFLNKKKEKEFEYTASKSFPRVGGINDEATDLPASPVKFVPKVGFQKHWRGFFTHYSYEEVYPVLPIFQRIPALEHFSDDEMEELKKYIDSNLDEQSDNDEELNSEVDAKLEEWYNRCLFENFFPVLEAEVKKLADPALGLKELYEMKDRLYTLAREKDNEKWEDVKLFDQWTEKLEIPAFRKVYENGKEIFSQYDRSVSEMLIGDDETYTSTVTMPGIITATNAPELKGNRVTWKFSRYHLFLHPVTMTVSSRRLNRWAVGGAALILLLLFLAFLVGFWVRRRKMGE